MLHKNISGSLIGVNSDSTVGNNRTSFRGDFEALGDKFNNGCERGFLGDFDAKLLNKFNTF
jgi:hypothetical protein